MRLDIYSPMHKAQRKNLFELSIKIGRADFSEAAQVATLKSEVQAIIASLRKHAQHEETFIHPLFKQLGTEGEHLEEEHHDLEITFANLEKCLAAEKQNDLYTQFNRMVVAYLKHIDAEETAQQDILWKHYDDAALMEAMKKFHASRKQEETMQAYEYMFPSLNPQEIQGMLCGAKAVFPADVYVVVESMARKAVVEVV